MSAKVRFCRWEKRTVNLSKMRDGTLRTETPLPGTFLLIVSDPVDEREFTVNVTTEDAAREVLSAIALTFPNLLT